MIKLITTSVLLIMLSLLSAQDVLKVTYHKQSNFDFTEKEDDPRFNDAIKRRTNKAQSQQKK